MKSIFILILTFLVIGCFYKNSDTKHKSTHSETLQTDTIKYYWSPDYDQYGFDTIINQVAYHLITYCLNDSAVYNETFSDAGTKNENNIEYSVAHNYASDILIKLPKSEEVKVHIIKETFINYLPIDFIKICHMYKNEYSQIDDDQLIFRATFAQPDTDYQFSIFYKISEIGEINVVKVEDESLAE